MPQMTHRVVITGASRGIGAQTARVFAEAGAQVALIARSADQIGALARELGALALPCDVSDDAQLSGAIARAQDAFGGVDVLINNAGVIDPIGPLHAADPEEWARLIDINVLGVFHGCRAVLPGMLAGGGGSILTVSSGAAHRPVEGWSAYCASKAAAAMITRSLHLDYGAQGVRAMGLSPGTIATDMQRQIKASGIGPVAQLDWSDHRPADWPARALLWMASAASDAYLGQEISLRDPQIQQQIGLT